MEGIDDQWDNAITEKAIVLRGVEDTAEKGQIETRLAELAVLTTLTDEQRWEKQYKEKRLAAINEREAQGNVGRLIKRGSGTLTLTAVNSYSGGTEIHGGTVAGLTESFGTGPVTVKSGAAVELHAAPQVHGVQRHHARALIVDDAAAQQIAVLARDLVRFEMPARTRRHHVDMADDA